MRAQAETESAQVLRRLAVAVEDWLSAKKAHLAARSVAIERANLKHSNPVFGKMLLCDIRSDDVSCYQAERLEAGASPKTINLEIGTLRAVFRKNRLWFAIQPDVRMLRASDDVGGQSPARKRVRCSQLVNRAVRGRYTLLRCLL
jgi:hypothetical protein